MSQPADDKTTTMLRERLDKLANSVGGGDNIDGAQLYRQGMRRRRRRIAATTGLAAITIVVVGAAIGTAVRQEASPEPSSPAPNNGCEVPNAWAPAIEAGALTEQQACYELLPGQQQIPTAPHVMHNPVGPSLLIEGWRHKGWVAQCRTGSYPLGEGYKAAELYCNAILKIAAGELEPTHICEPQDCGKLKLLWAYDEAELQDLANAMDPDKPEVSVDVAPGSFGTYYWRLFESELHSELGFEPRFVDNGMLADGDRWFRMSGLLERGRIEVYVWRTQDAPPPVLHEPYVRDFEEPPQNLNGVFLIARDDNGTMVRADLIGSGLSSNEKQRFRESVASVIQA